MKDMYYVYLQMPYSKENESAADYIVRKEEWTGISGLTFCGEDELDSGIDAVLKAWEPLRDRVDHAALVVCHLRVFSQGAVISADAIRKVAAAGLSLRYVRNNVQLV